MTGEEVLKTVIIFQRTTLTAIAKSVTLSGFFVCFYINSITANESRLCLSSFKCLYYFYFIWNMIRYNENLGFSEDTAT